MNIQNAGRIVTMAVFAVLVGSVVAGEEVHPLESVPSVREFESISQGVSEGVHTGMIIAEYESQVFPSATERAEKIANYEKKQKDINANVSLSPDKKKAELQGVQAHIDAVIAGRDAILNERFADTIRIVFDRQLQRMKCEREPLDPNNLILATADLLRMGRDTVRPAEIRRVTWVTEDTYIDYQPDFNLVVVGPSTGLVDSIPFYGVFVRDKLARGYDPVRAETAIVDGRALVAYTFADPTKQRRLVVYADPKLDYRYRQILFVDGDVVVREIKAQDYQTYCGVPFPTVHEDVQYHLDKEHSVKFRERWRILAAQFNNPIDARIFRVPIRSGTYVDDERVHRQYEVGQGDMKGETLEDVMGWNPTPYRR